MPHFSSVFTGADAATFAWLLDAEHFYEKGPGIHEDNPAIHAIAKPLLRDFSAAINAAATDPQAARLSLCFTHAEIIIPFVTRLGVPPHFAPACEPARWHAGGRSYRLQSLEACYGVA